LHWELRKHGGGQVLQHFHRDPNIGIPMAFKVKDFRIAAAHQSGLFIFDYAK
jgi:hypothetical protein